MVNTGCVSQILEQAVTKKDGTTELQVVDKETGVELNPFTEEPKNAFDKLEDEILNSIE